MRTAIQHRGDFALTAPKRPAPMMFCVEAKPRLRSPRTPYGRFPAAISPHVETRIREMSHDLLLYRHMAGGPYAIP
jgi:hypothetical protein